MHETVHGLYTRGGIGDPLRRSADVNRGKHLARDPNAVWNDRSDERDGERRGQQRGRRDAEHPEGDRDNLRPRSTFQT